ncbi:MAG TPA: thioredoxin [Acidimicrobiia bacterium]
MELVNSVVKGSDAERLMLLVHGYGADERDLGALLQYLDPDGKFAAVLPRGPMAVEGTPGYAWYDFGTLEPQALADGFAAARGALDDLVDEQCKALGYERSASVFGGFSQGAGLSLALGLGRTAKDRPLGVLALSPAVPSFEVIDLDPNAAGTVPVLIQHGTNDPLVPVKRARGVARDLQRRRVPVVFREYPMQHNVTLDSMRDAAAWLTQVLAGERPDEPVPDDPIKAVEPVTTAEWQREVVESELPVIVDFWAPWCQPCRQVAPVIEQMSRMRQGSYRFVKVNIDEEPQLAQTYDVQSIPMIGLFRAGRLERRSLGAKARQQLEAELGMIVIP